MGYIIIMMMMSNGPPALEFFVAGEPIPKGSMKGFVAKGRAILTHDNKRSRPWATTITLMAQAHRQLPLWAGPLRVDLTFNMPKPQGLPKRRYSWAIRKPDKDKLERLVKDALTKVIYRDDAQIVDGRVIKRYSDQPGVLIQIWRVSWEL